MFNSLHEEDANVSKPIPDQSYIQDSQRFSERDEINFSHGSSRRQKQSSQSNFSKDLNSQCSDSFMFLRGRVDSHDKLNQGSQPQMLLGNDLKPTNQTLHDPPSNLYPQSVLNKLDVNSFSKSQNNSKHKLSDMFGSGNDVYRGRLAESTQRVPPKKYDQMRLGKRDHNRTSIFQNQAKDHDLRRHIDFVSNGNQNFMFNSNGMLRKTEVTRMMSLLGDKIPTQKKHNFCMSIQRGQKEEDLASDWVKQSDDKPNIQSFGKMWSGLESTNNPEDIKQFALESMVNFEKETSQMEDLPVKIKRNMCSGQLSEGSRHSLISDMDLTFNDVGRLGPGRHSKYALPKSKKAFNSKPNLTDIYSEDNGFVKNSLQPRIPEAEEESELSRPSKNPKLSEGDSMYISELNDTSSKDRLLLKVLMENSGKKVNINTLNTNINTVNNNNNNLNYISNSRANQQEISENEIQFVKYLNNIKNYFVDPNSKAIFLKIGVEEEEKQDEDEQIAENQSTQLVPLVKFIQTGNPLYNSEAKATPQMGNLDRFICTVDSLFIILFVASVF